MGEIRGERVVFGRQDIVALHELPSAQAHDPMIVHCPLPTSSVKRVFGIFVGLLLLVALGFAGLIGAVEAGLFDKTLSTRAKMALGGAIGPRYTAQVGSTVIRFASGPRLALEARDVNTIERDSGRHLSRTESIRLVLDPLALFSGKIAISEIEADGIQLDTALLPAGKPIDVSGLRVDQIPNGLETLFRQLDMLRGFIDRGKTDAVRIAGLDLRLPVSKGKPLSVVLDEVEMRRDADGSLSLEGGVTIDGAPATLSVHAQSQGERTVSLSADIGGLVLTPFLMKWDVQGLPRQGLDGTLNLQLNAKRAEGDEKPSLALNLGIDKATFYSESIAQDVGKSDVSVIYDFDKNSLEFLQSTLRFGETTVPFTAAVIDLDRLDPKSQSGFGIDLLVSDGVAATAGTGVAPLAYGAKVTGRYVTGIKELQLERMAVSSPLGSMAGSMVVRFKGEGSPEISFGAQSPRVQTGAVKQLWPFWMAPKARTWALANIYGGTITNASIAVFIPQGRIPPGGGPLHLDETELSINFDMDDARLNVAGDIPPVRDVVAHFDLRGPRLTVGLKSGASFFPSGRSVAISGGEFVIPATYDKPLMAQIDMSVAGAADAVAELITYKPIKVLQRTGFEPTDFSGAIKADVQATFGLVNSQNPPSPVWRTHMQLAGVDLGKEITGRKIGDLDGTLDVDNQRAVLDAKGSVDKVPMDIHLVEPVDSGSKVQKERVITATVNNEQRDLLAPGLGEILSGSTKFELSRLDDDRQAVSVDLTRSVLSIPWLGWTKGSGVPAKAEFELSSDGPQVRIRDFQLTGQGFGAAGSLEFGKAGLVSADFSRVRLTGADNYGVKVKRGKSGYDIAVSGKKADIRPVIARMRSQQSGSGEKDDAAITLRADLDNILGFNDETISNVSLVYAARGSRIDRAEFSGVTESGQAIVVQTETGGDGSQIQVTSSDAGAVARFTDVYKRMQGGLLNLKLRAGKNSSWAGNVDIRTFRLANEQKLQSMVSTPVGNDGRSLNNAVRRDIDVSSERFQRGFARVIVQNDVVKIENGVVRGEQVGATFQGTLRDKQGNMDMTGTFMPAYGLNRLFAELPLVGVILGNGRDRGLLGITFRLQGSFAEPRLTVNPLSLIAPGVFRQIFEF